MPMYEQQIEKIDTDVMLAPEGAGPACVAALRSGVVMPVNEPIRRIAQLERLDRAIEAAERAGFDGTAESLKRIWRSDLEAAVKSIWIFQKGFRQR